MTQPRIVVTGMATINPLGDTLEEFYANLLAGKSGIRRWHSIDTSRIESHMAGDIGDYDTKTAMTRWKDRLSPQRYKSLRKLFRTAPFSLKMGVLTAISAYAHAGLLDTDCDPFRIAAIIGGHNFHLQYIAKNHSRFEEDVDSMDPLIAMTALDTHVAAAVSEVLNIRGACYTIGGACSSTNLALRDATREIQCGDADTALVVGAIFDMGPMDVQSMAVIRSIPVHPELHDDPTTSSRPYDKTRSGFLPSHGAGTLVIESLDHAQDRGAKIYAEVLGVHANADADYHPTPNHDSQVRLYRDLLQKCGLKPEQIDYINAHATSTPTGDIAEFNALKEVFGEHIYKLKINAPKSMLGHTCWSAPVIETIAAILQMNGGKLHPTVNVTDLDPGIDPRVDICRNGPVEHEVRYFLKNAFGFGGINCCSILKRWEGE